MPGLQDKLFQFTAENSEEMIVRFGMDGCINSINKKTKTLTGYAAEELKGAFVGELFKEVFKMEGNQFVIDEKFKNKTSIETVVYRKNKTCFPVSLKIVKMEYDGFETNFAMALDMTVYKETIRRLEEKNEEVQSAMKERDSFVANVTHELRTPVNGIKGHTEILKKQEEDPEKLQYLKMILDCCQNMQGIINNILDFSKLEAGKFQLDEKPFSFREVMKSAEGTFQTLASQKGLRFSMNIAENIPDKLIGDDLRITQILNNLVSNAVKFTQKGYVGVEAVKNMQVKDEIELFFMVVDTGIGLSPEAKDKLFKSFSQADSSITRRFGGTGLGLSITKELVNMMGGDIWAEGVEGKGSSFSFTIRLRLEEYVDEQDEVIKEISTWDPGQIFESLVGERDLMYEFGTEENGREIRNAFEKLSLSMDMDNWYKAESEADNIKELLKGGSKDLNKLAFKLEMSVRKADLEKSKALLEEVMALTKAQWKPKDDYMGDQD